MELKKKEYSSIKVDTDFRDVLKDLARKQNMTINNYLKSVINIHEETKIVNMLNTAYKSSDMESYLKEVKDLEGSLSDGID